MDGERGTSASPGDASWVGSMPDLYDRGLGPVLFAPWAALVAAEVARLGPRRVLELAAGSGIVTQALASALPGAEIVATDLNPAMVAFGSSRVPHASWQVADAQDLTVPHESYDAVVCQFGAMFFPDRPGAFAQARRVLADGGTFVLTVWDRVEFSTLAAALVASCETVLGEQAPDFVRRVPYGYADVAQVRHDLATAGFSDVDIDRHVPSATTGSLEAVVRGFCLGTPLRFELERCAPIGPLTDEITTEFVRRLGPAPVTGELGGYLVRSRA